MRRMFVEGLVAVSLLIAVGVIVYGTLSFNWDRAPVASDVFCECSRVRPMGALGRLPDGDEV